MAKPIMFDKLTENGQTVLVPKPQHLDKDGKPVETGENNPLPTADGDVESRLSKIEDKLDSVIDDDKVNMQLTGSNVELIDSVKDKELTDASVYSGHIDVSEYKDKAIVIKNTGDSVAQIWLVKGYIDDVQTFFIKLQEEVPSNSDLLISENDDEKINSMAETIEVVFYKSEDTTVDILFFGRKC